MRTLAAFALTIFAGSALGAGIAWAQDDAALARTGLFVRDRNVTVTERPKPEYRPLPIPVDGLLLTPTITGSMEYNDNIYAVNTGQTSDEIFHIQPGLVITSNWDRNAISAFARASANEYVNHTTESTTDWSTGANGRLDIQHDWGLAAGTTYQELTEPRSSSGSPTDITAPIRYYLSDNFIESTKEFDRFRFTVRGGFQDYSYINAYTPQGAVVYQEDRDEGVISGAFKAEYAVIPDTSIFADLVLNQRDFYNRLSIEPTRNSGGYEATVGANFDLTHLLRGEIYIGYLEQEYRSPDYKGVGGLSLRGTLYYFPTQLTTVTLTGGRTVQDSDILGAGPYLSSNYTLQLDHELLRNLVLTGNFTYGNDVYQGYDRTDDRYIFSAGGTYLLTRTIGLNLKYTHYVQDSYGTERGLDFVINSAVVSLTYQFGG
jgi:hypothetical protein